MLRGPDGGAVPAVVTAEVAVNDSRREAADLTGNVGTVRFMAPEMMKATGKAGLYHARPLHPPSPFLGLSIRH